MWELNNSVMCLNNTNVAYNPRPPVAVELVLYSLFLVSSLVGNVLVVTVFYRDKTLRTSVNYFIVNMSLSDLTVPTISLPLLITRTIDRSHLLDNRFLSKVFCKVSWTLWSVSVLVSMFSMTALAADRFRAIIFPMKTVLFSQKKCFAAIAIMWVFSFAFYGCAATFTSCYDSQMTPEMFSFLLIFFGMFFLFLVLLTLLYLKIAIFLYRQKNSVHLAAEVVRKRARRNRKIITMPVIIVVLFYAAWIPFYIMQFVSYIYPKLLIPSIAYYILLFLYPAINPVVYFVFNEKYRQGFKEILCCLWFCNNKSNGNFQPKFSPGPENGVYNSGHVNQTMANLELQEK